MHGVERVGCRTVRAFISGTVGKKMGLTAKSNKAEDVRRSYSVKA